MILSIRFLLYDLVLLILLFIYTLVIVAYSTLLERKILAIIQRRFGPVILGIFGLLQPFADGLKLFIKERILPYKATLLLFFLAPMLVFIFSMFLWLFLPLSQFLYSDLSLNFLYNLVLTVLEVYGVMFAGWSSNSKYAFLGGLRSTAQMISYEISLGFIFLSLILLTGSFNLFDIMVYQYSFNFWFCMPLLPLCLIFLISMLAETNRAPFDLPEAEAELVAGFNVEYSGFFFALFFLGEYSNMLFLSSLFVLLFLGGGSFFFFHSRRLLWVFSFLFSLKICFIYFYFIWVRATLPRYRYDQLMELGWQTFLPLTFGCLIAIIALSYFFKIFPL